MIIITITKTPKFIKISDILNTGKSTKLSFIKSLTYPKTILSYILQNIPAHNKDANKRLIPEAF